MTSTDPNQTPFHIAPTAKKAKLYAMVTLPPELLEAPELPLILQAFNFQLENESLARHDFREWLSPEVKAEFINGKKIVHSPARDIHNCVVLWLANILNAFSVKHGLGRVYVEKALIGLSRNDYEPDLVFFKADRVKEFKRDQMIYPAPDLGVEVLSEPSRDRDRGIKYRDYAAHGVPEYWIVDADAETVERYVNDQGSFVLHPVGGDYILRSPLFPGLELPLKAIFDEAANHAFVGAIHRSQGAP